MDVLALLLGALLAAPAGAAAPAHGVLPFIEDDYPKALEQARQRRLPLFIEAWAPW
jgi:hypothetical protein